MKGNLQKKMTFEDRFDRKYACWVQNNPKAWRFWKRKNRKEFRRKLRQLDHAEREQEEWSEMGKRNE